MKIRKVVIPAAGLGTRFLPATKSIAKEMLPIVDTPCIQYLVEEAVKSGIKDIIIITSDGKRSIKDHFRSSNKLYAHLSKRNKTAALQEMEKIEKLANFHFVKQPRQLGDGHAILCAYELIKNEPFAVLFGDDIYDNKKPALAQLIEQYEKFHTPIIGLLKIDKKESEKYGIFYPKKQTGRSYEAKDLIEKPHPSKAPSNLAIVGKYIVTPELLQDLKKSKSSSHDREIRLIDGMRKYLKHSPIHGYELMGERFDTGDKLGYLKAVVHFGLKHKELKNDFKKYLREII